MRRIEVFVNVFDGYTLTQQNKTLKNEMEGRLDEDFFDLLDEEEIGGKNIKIEKITCAVVNDMIVHTVFISYDEE